MSRDGVEVECPLGCGYSGRPQSVEAHISRLTDDVHKGEVGSSFRAEMGAAPSSTTTEPQIDESPNALAVAGLVGAVGYALSRVIRP